MADGLLNKASIILTPTGYKAGTLYNVAPVVEPYEDFDFARASVASRVNSSGLVEMVGRTLGSELVTNGDFATDSDWTKGTGTTISNGSANFVNSGGLGLWQNVGTQSVIVKVTFDVTIYTSGTLNVYSGGNQNVGIINVVANSLGSYTAYVDRNGGNSNIIFGSSNNFTGSIDNVSVKEIIDTNNIPRISYDSNGDNGHILLEPTSTNLVGYSLPNDTNWSKGSNTTITENFAVSPDGTQNASRFVMPTGSGTYAYYQFTATSTTDHTLSFYAKNNGGDADVTMAFFVASQTQNITLTNEWQRFEFTTSITSGNAVQVGVDNITSVDMLIYGVQCEALPYATSYIPTLTGSTVTRATETATGAGSADLINSTEGVLYAEIAALADGGDTRTITISSAANNRITLSLHSTTNRVQFYIAMNGYVNTVDLDATDISQTNMNKIACKFKANDYALWINGVEKDTNTTQSNTVQSGTLNSLNFDINGSNNFYGKVKAVAVFNEALSDAELNNLTG